MKPKQERLAEALKKNLLKRKQQKVERNDKKNDPPLPNLQALKKQ